APPVSTNASAGPIVARAILTVRSPWMQYSEARRHRGVGRSMQRAGCLHATRGVALDADIHASAAEGEIVQCQGFPPGGKHRRIRFHQPGIADTQSAETIEQALQVAAGACEEVADVVARRLGAHIERRLERATAEVGSEPCRGIDLTAYACGGDRPRCDTHR